MNTECATLLRSRAQQVAQHGGYDAFRKHVQQHYRLRTVLRESHNTPIQQLLFNHIANDDTNLLASVGYNQATVYDDMHMGDYIAMVVHFENVETEWTKGGELTACCWLHGNILEEHPAGDALLAVAGEDHSISIISVVSAEVVALLPGHASAIIALSSSQHLPGLMLSLAVCGTIKLWDVAAGTCLLTLPTDSFTAALHPDGSHIVAGSRRGQLSAWRLGAEGQPGSISVQQEPQQSVLQLETSHVEAVDCIRFTAGGLLLSKSLDGRMSCYSWPQQRQLSTWRIPSGKAAAGGSGRSRSSFGTTSDGAYVCAGNAAGDLFVFSTATGLRTGSARQDKLSGGVTSCAISEDCRHLLAAIGNGFLFRFEYRAASGEEQQGGGDDVAGGKDQREGADGDDDDVDVDM